MAVATVCGIIGLTSGIVIGFVFRDKVRLRLIRYGLLAKPKTQANLSPPPQEVAYIAVKLCKCFIFYSCYIL